MLEQSAHTHVLPPRDLARARIQACSYLETLRAKPKRKETTFASLSASSCHVTEHAGIYSWFAFVMRETSSSISCIQRRRRMRQCTTRVSHKNSSDAMSSADSFDIVRGVPSRSSLRARWRLALHICCTERLKLGSTRKHSEILTP